MSTTDTPAAPSYWQPLRPASPGNVSVQTAIRRVLADIYPGIGDHDRRQAPRFPFPYLVPLQPMTPDGLSRQGPPLVVVGKQVSEAGLGFYHPKPLPSRVACVTLGAAQESVQLLLELLWTQFTEHGWYESGGRFLRVVE